MGLLRLVRGRMQVVILVMLALVGVVASVAPAAAATVYADPQGRFAIGIGDGWIQQQPDTQGVVALWNIDNNSAIFNIVNEKIPAGMSSVDYAQANIAGVSTFNGYTELRRDFITSADQQAPLLDYTVISDSGQVQRIQQVFVTKGSDGWVLTFRSKFSDRGVYDDQVSAMIYTFTL